MRFGTDAARLHCGRDRESQHNEGHVDVGWVGAGEGGERGGYARRSLRSAQNGPNPSHVRMKNSMCRKSSAGGRTGT